jgi:hypothetical protein
VNPKDELTRLRRIPAALMLETFAQYIIENPGTAPTIGELFDYSRELAYRNLRSRLENQNRIYSRIISEGGMN